jgi:hypothetical protein
VAALLFTVTTSYIFAIDEFNWPAVEARWGAQVSSILHDVQLGISFVACLFNILSTIVSVVILMIYGELDSGEASHFQQLMGLRQSVGFQLLMLSAPMTGLMIIIHGIIFSTAITTTFSVLMAIFGVCVYVTLFQTMMPAMDTLYHIKFASQTSRPTTLSGAELSLHVQCFCAEFGVALLSESAVLRYIALSRDSAARSASAAERSASFTQRVGLSTVLSPGSRKLLSALIEKALQGYVDANMAEVGDAMMAKIKL